MAFLRPERRRKGERALAWVGAVFIIVLLVFGVSYLALGTPTATAEDINTVVLYDTTGNAVNVTDITKTDNAVEFTASAPAHKIVIKLSDYWKDLKGQFSHIHIDLQNAELSDSVDGAKIYLSDGYTEIYIGLLKLSDTKTFDSYVDFNDIKNFEDYAYAQIIIKLYDQNGTAINGLESGTQKIGFRTYVKAETSSIVAFVTTVIIALAVAFRKMAHAVASTLVAFLSAITTNNAVVILLSFVVVLVALWYLIDVKKVKRPAIIKK